MPHQEAYRKSCPSDTDLRIDLQFANKTHLNFQCKSYMQDVATADLLKFVISFTHHQPFQNFLSSFLSFEEAFFFLYHLVHFLINSKHLAHLA
jgi:hypothetical protein